MSEKKLGKRLLTWVLVLVMMLSLLPIGILAADGTDETAEDGEVVLAPVAGVEEEETAPVEDAPMLLAAPAAGNTPIEVPVDNLDFDNGVIKGIEKTWLDTNKDKPLSVTIPAEINGTPVTTIGIQAFQRCKNLIRIDLSNTSITAIQKRAFYECTALKEVILPDSLEVLGNLENDGGLYTAGSIFYGCSNMESIRTESSDEDATFELPANLTAIGKHTFYGCFKNDVKVVIPESVKEIGQEAFYYKSGSVDHITQIVLKSTDVSGYHKEAFDFRSGSSRMLVFANKTVYDNYNPRSAIKRIMTYPVEITFDGANETELHLNGKPLGYQLDNTTGFWELSGAYALPTAPGSGTPVDPKPGYKYVTGGGWKLEENNEVLDVTKNLKADQDEVTAVSGGGKYELLAPTISYLVDGKTEDVNADQPFTVTIGDGKKHTLGVEVYHPLLLSEQGNEEDEYVYFEYCWWDEGHFADKGKTMTVNGPRSTEEPNLFSTAETNRELHRVWVKDNTIPITKVDHARTNHNYYLVEICGYIVKDGKPERFYQSSNNFIQFGYSEGVATVRNYYTLQVKVDEVRVITATADEHGKIDPAAGTVTVPKGENQTFKITPNEGYHINDVLVDGKSVGAVTEYKFENVTEAHKIHATFARNYTPSYPIQPEQPKVDIPDDDALGLNTTDHFAYIVGYGNGQVRPQNAITRAEVATIFFRLLTDDVREENFTSSNKYTDVAAGAWYNNAVSTLSAMGIITGYPDGTFRPNAYITRAEFAAIAARFDADGDKTLAAFSDIANHWAKDEISVAYNNGWVDGYPDGTFGPQRNITRAETVTLVNRVLNRKPETEDDLLPDMTTWTDNADKKAWYYLAIQEATNSHYYKYKENSEYEKWTELRETRDWTQLEK